MKIYEVGKIFENSKGYKFEIIEKVDGNRRKIRFIESKLEKIVNLTAIKNKLVRDTSILDDYEFSVGKIFKTNEGCEVQIVEHVDYDHRKIKFIGYDYYTISNITSLITGSIKNPYYPSVCGVGYLGVGEYKTTENKIRTKEYKLWSSVISRCYRNDSQRNKPYINTTVCEEWHNYQNFAKWYNAHFPKHIEGIRFDLDKDILQYGVKNKVYSPETCVFLPKRINLFISTENSKGITPLNNGKWSPQIRDFKLRKNLHLKACSSSEEARDIYVEYRNKNVEYVKDYLRELQYLPEHIIQLIK